MTKLECLKDMLEKVFPNQGYHLMADEWQDVVLVKSEKKVFTSKILKHLNLLEAPYYINNTTSTAVFGYATLELEYKGDKLHY